MTHVQIVLGTKTAQAKPESKAARFKKWIREVLKKVKLPRKFSFGAGEKKAAATVTEKGVYADNKAADSLQAAGNAEVPIIDISDIFSQSLDARLAVAKKIGKACEDIGFFVITNHGVGDEVVNNMWNQTSTFFDRPVDEKLALIKPQSEYPFGYTKYKGEVLSRGKAVEIQNADGTTTSSLEEAPPDLKEMFSLGPANPKAGFPERLFPINPDGFSDAWAVYYDTLAKLAENILKSFALALELKDENFFQQFVDHHASALRALNYPDLGGEKPVPGQLRASAHTDYGTITILRSDGPGLQVSKDKNPPNWIDVPFVKDGFIVNLGDLMKRWTNEKYLSTLHRVVNPTDTNWEEGQSTRRQSVAFFHNLNKDALVENLTKDKAKHEPIIAGDFLMQKHLATQQHLEEK